MRSSPSFAHSKRRPCGAPSRTTPLNNSQQDAAPPLDPKRRRLCARTQTDTRHFEVMSKQLLVFCLLFFFFFRTHRLVATAAAGDKSSSALAGEHAPSSRCCPGYTSCGGGSSSGSARLRSICPAVTRRGRLARDVRKSVKQLLRGSARLCASGRLGGLTSTVFLQHFYSRGSRFVFFLILV